MPLVATRGAASAQGFGEFAQSAAPNYIEDVFSTWLYTGNGSPLTINNGIDLAGKGGLTWFKDRTTAQSHVLIDSVRGTNKTLFSNETRAEVTQSWSVTYNSNGMTLPGSAVDSSNGVVNFNGYVMASWTFREQPKFFDVVTWTGDASGNRTLSHTLASTPGCIIIKATNAVDDWYVYHTSLGTGKWLYLNTTGAEQTGSIVTAVSSTTFTVSQSNGFNTNGRTYVAYLFAHNAGGFGLSGTDNVISCGSFTTDGSGNATVNLGYEPQWLMVKGTSSGWPWYMFDNMRGMPVGTDSRELDANSSAAETGIGSSSFYPTATGFYMGGFGSNTTYIYIAIRRGPMRTPTTGTSVYFPQAYADGSLGSENPTNLGASAGFPVDMFMHSMRQETTFCSNIFDRLRGSNPALITSGTDAESTGEPLNAFQNAFDIMSGIKSRNNNRFYFASAIGRNHIAWNFRRAPGFFDEVCWTRSTTVATLNHNLGVVPELIIKKDRSRGATFWEVMPNVSPYDFRFVIYLNDTQAISGPSGGIYWNAAPTATTFDVNMGFDGSSNGDNFVAYLFASCPGVSKVGSYTGTGTTQVINCGFTGGARFVLIKRTDSTGDWYVWDSARGIVAGNDPYLLLNSTAAEVTNTDFVDTAATGFEISSTAPAAINANGGTFIFLAIA